MTLDFTIDIDTGTPVVSAANARPTQITPSAKLSIPQMVRVQYVRIPGGIGVGTYGTPVAAPDPGIKFGLKAGTVQSGQYAAVIFDAFADEFAAPADPTQTTAWYTATLSAISADVANALFPVDSGGNSPGTASLIGEIVSGTNPSATFAFTAINNLIRGSESPGTAGPTGYPSAQETQTAVAQAAAAAPANDPRIVNAASTSNPHFASPLPLLPSSSGTLLADDFSAGLGQYTITATAGKWASGREPAYVASTRSQITALAGVPGTPYAGGLREGHLLVDADGSWVAYADGGDGTGAGPGFPWHVQIFRSADLGLTWAYVGAVTPNAADASGTAGVARFGSQYVLYLVKSGGFTDGDIPATPYTDAVYTGTSAIGPFTPVPGAGLTLGAAGSYDDQTALTGCVILYRGQYLNFYSALGSTAGYNVGLATGPTPLGPWTKLGAVLPAGIAGNPENPKVWYSPVLSCWCMTTNQINLSTARTESNRMFFSANVLDWSAARSLTTQRLCYNDAIGAIGMSCPFILQDGAVAQPGGEVPIVFDADPIDGNHRGRSLHYATLRPSPFSLRYTPASTPTSGVETCLRVLPSADFIVEFAFQLDAASSTNYLTFDYRVAPNGDRYRLFAQTGAALALVKIVGGVQSTIYVPPAPANVVVAGEMHRVRIEVSGITHNAYLDGNPHVANAQDGTLPNAGLAGFGSFNAAGAVRLYSARVSDSISLLNAPAGTYTLRGAGGIPLVTATSTGATLSLGDGYTPSPIRFLQAPFELFSAPPGGFTGGDALRPVASPPPTALASVLSTFAPELTRVPGIESAPGTDYLAPDGDASNLTNVPPPAALKFSDRDYIQTFYNNPGDFWIYDSFSSQLTEILSGPNTLGPLDGSALTGDAANLAAGFADGYSGNDFGGLSGSGFNSFFNGSGFNTDTSLPGDGSFSFGNGLLQGFQGPTYVAIGGGLEVNGVSQFYGGLSTNSDSLRGDGTFSFGFGTLTGDGTYITKLSLAVGDPHVAGQPYEDPTTHAVFISQG